VRHHPIKDLAVVKCDTVEGYVSAAMTFLFDLFAVSDLRVNPATGTRFPLYSRLTRNFKRRDPRRKIRSAFMLAHLRRSREAAGRTAAPICPRERWAAMATYLGLRSCEFLHSGYVAKRVSFDGLPRGILASDVFYVTAGGVALPLDATFEDADIKKVRIRFREQKNGDNGISRDCNRNGDPHFDPVVLMLEARSLFLRLPGHPARTSPFAVDVDGKHLTSRSMAYFIKATIRKAMPGISAEEVALFTCHSFRVGALQHLLQSSVSVDQAVDYLRWRSAAYMLYIRSSAINFSSLTAGGNAIIADFEADANYESDTDDITTTPTI